MLDGDFKNDFRYPKRSTVEQNRPVFIINIFHSLEAFYLESDLREIQKFSNNLTACLKNSKKKRSTRNKKKKKHWPNNVEARYRAANAFIDHKEESVRDIPPCQIETLELEERGLFLTARIITVTESCGMHYYVRGVKFGAATVAVPFQLCSVSRYHDCPSAWISYWHQSIGKRNRNGETSRWNRCMCTRATRWSNGLVASVCRSRRKSSIGRPAITGASREITFSIFLSPRLEPLRRFLPTDPPLLFHRSMCFNCSCSFFLLSSFFPFVLLFLCSIWEWKDMCCEWKTP